MWNWRWNQWVAQILQWNCQCWWLSGCHSKLSGTQWFCSNVWNQMPVWIRNWWSLSINCCLNLNWVPHVCSYIGTFRTAIASSYLDRPGSALQWKSWQDPTWNVMKSPACWPGKTWINATYYCLKKKLSLTSRVLFPVCVWFFERKDESRNIRMSQKPLEPKCTST